MGARASPARPRPCPCHCFPFLSPRPIVLLLRQRQPFSGRRVMSSFSSTSRSSWPQYGPVPLTRCPDCPRPEPLKRSICKTDDNGNRGREYLTCESLPYREGDKILKKCKYFEWIDVYVKRLQLQESIGAIGERNLGGGGLAVENAAERGSVPIMPNAPNAELVEVKGELKKMNKQLRQLIELKKQANLMAGCFFLLYNCDRILIIAHQALEVVTRVSACVRGRPTPVCATLSYPRVCMLS